MMNILSGRVAKVGLSVAVFSFAGTLIPASWYSGFLSTTPNMPLELTKIGKNLVKKVPTLEVSHGNE